MDTTPFLSSTALCTSGRLLGRAVMHEVNNRLDAIDLYNAGIDANQDVIKVQMKPYRWPIQIVKLAPPPQFVIDAFIERCAAVGLGDCTPERAAELVRLPETLPKLQRLEQRVAALRSNAAKEKKMRANAQKFAERTGAIINE